MNTSFTSALYCLLLCLSLSPVRAGADENESQAYGQAILNVLFADRVAIGLVPTLPRMPSVPK